MDDIGFLNDVSDALFALPTVRAVTLGGSRAQGTSRPDSDWDLAIYYRGQFRPQSLRDLGWSGEVSEIGGWGGGVFNGGAWLHIDGRSVDVHNALRHTPAGGHVTVRAASAGARVKVTVTDDGDGIPTDQLHAMFDRFHRIDPSRATTDGSGSGLGLTIARGIVADHGGALTAASDGPGTGAAFTVSLPRSE